jgi:invasion protein IalB
MPRLLSLAMTLATLSFPAAAQDAVEGWDAKCGADSCTISRGLKDIARDKLVATFLVSVPKGDGAVTAGVAVALGVALVPGARFYSGGTEYALAFEVCFPDGCRALRTFEQAEMDQIGASAEMEVRFFPYGSDTPVSIMMPIEGLVAAIGNARKTLSGG